MTNRFTFFGIRLLADRFIPSRSVTSPSIKIVGDPAALFAARPLASTSGLLFQQGSMDAFLYLALSRAVARQPILMASQIDDDFTWVRLGVLIWTWANQAYGKVAGVAALFAYSFCPTMLAYSHYVTTDFGAGRFFHPSFIPPSA